MSYPRRRALAAGERGQSDRDILIAMAAVVAVLVIAFGVYRFAFKDSGSDNARGDEAAAVATKRPSIPTAGGTPAPAVHWRPCEDGFQCATLTAPLDYTRPEAKTVEIALIRLPATDPVRRIGSLVVNPGGPGGSGIEFVREAADFVFGDEVRARFDIVGFDPRGVGASYPPISCYDALDDLISSDIAPRTEAERVQLDDQASRFARGCQERSGELLPYVTARDVARDMDRLRAALGDQKLTYVGFSYGTLLGASYAELFPQNVRALVLDGAVDPALSAEDSLRTQVRGFETSLDRFLDRCSRNASCPFHSNGDAGSEFDRLMARIDDAPLGAAHSADGREVDSAMVWLGVAAALYDHSDHRLLARALADASRGDGSTFLGLVDSYTQRSEDGKHSNFIEANIAIGCVDWPRVSAQAYPQLLADIRTIAPRFSQGIGYHDVAICDHWPIPSARPAGPIHAHGAPPILVIGTTGDPATPHAEAASLAAELESGVLLTYEGEGHTAYGGDSSCVDGTVEGYLIRLTIPAPGKVCAGPLSATNEAPGAPFAAGR